MYGRKQKYSYGPRSHPWTVTPKDKVLGLDELYPMKSKID